MIHEGDAMQLTDQDRTTLRELAKRVAEIAAEPVMETRRKRWVEHNTLRSQRPMVLVFPEGGWTELMPPEALTCEGEDARAIELDLRRRIYTFEHFADDSVIVADWPIRPAIHTTGWGLEPVPVPSSAARGAGHYEQVLTGPKDLAKMHHPEITVDEPATERRFAEMSELLGDVLDVRLAGVNRVSFHLPAMYIKLAGPMQMLLDMVERPAFVHEAIAFFAEGHHKLMARYVELNLLGINNDNTYHNSGGNGWTDELPAGGFDPSRVRPRDMWASAEAQELAGVSPAMHEEFALQYERPLLEPFGLTGYGCCEDLTHKLDEVLRIPQIRRISISPFADVEACAERLGGDYIFSWKPNPSMLVGRFDPDRVEAYLRHAIDVAAANGCVLEMILKDTHTCEGHPERFDEWASIAGRLSDEAGQRAPKP